MHAEHLVREGDLAGALADLQEEIRNHPENVPYRIFLFQLLAVLGRWERALNQLYVLGNLDKEAWPMVQTYQTAIRCEVLRTEIFAGRRKPLIFGEPPHWMAWLLESLRFIGEAQCDKALSLRDQAFEQAAEIQGTIDEQPFKWIADADTRLGPVLELILNGRYYWAPLQQIRSISISGVVDLRDLVWLPARFAWINGGQAHGLIPTRYVGSEDAEDSSIRLARKTGWQEVADGIYRGLGQRIFATDQGEYPLLDVREIVLHEGPHQTAAD